MDSTLRDANQVALPFSWFDRFRTKTSVLSHECRRLAGEGAYLEFGVFQGRSIRRAARLLPRRRLYGFDSFEGLPQDGRTDWGQDFSVPQLPVVPPNVTLVKGWFDATLPAFLGTLEDPIALVHIDCDIYSSTHFVLSELHRQGRLVPGARFVFDELFNHPHHLWNEQLALYDVLASAGLGFRWRSITRRARPLRETLELLELERFPTRELWRQTRSEGYWFQAGALELTEKPVTPSSESVSVARELAERFTALTERHYRGTLRPSRAIVKKARGSAG